MENRIALAVLAATVFPVASNCNPATITSISR